MHEQSVWKARVLNDHFKVANHVNRESCLPSLNICSSFDKENAWFSRGLGTTELRQSTKKNLRIARKHGSIFCTMWLTSNKFAIFLNLQLQKSALFLIVVCYQLILRVEGASNPGHMQMKYYQKVQEVKAREELEEKCRVRYFKECDQLKGRNGANCAFMANSATLFITAALGLCYSIYH